MDAARLAVLAPLPLPFGFTRTDLAPSVPRAVSEAHAKLPTQSRRVIRSGGLDAEHVFAYAVARRTDPRLPLSLRVRSLSLSCKADVVVSRVPGKGKPVKFAGRAPSF